MTFGGWSPFQSELFCDLISLSRLVDLMRQLHEIYRELHKQRLLLHFCPSCSLKKKFHFAYNKNRYKNGFCPSQQACNTREGSLSYTTSYTHSRSREVRKTLQLKQNCCARWAEASYLCFGISVSLARGFKGLKHLCSYLFNSSNI